MENVKKVNIGGFAFILDEKAYALLKGYMDSLETHYLKVENGKEIVEGIEGRLAELLMDKAGKTGVVSQQIAQKCIDTLGHPEDFDDSEEMKPAQKDKSKKKKLFRDSDDKLIGGVFSGLAAFFGVDPLLFRLGSVALWVLCIILAEHTSCLDALPSIIPVLYIILWICVPLAKTNQQRYEMRGEEISLDEIERQVNERSAYRRGSNAFGVICKIMLIIIGGFFLLIGISGLIAIFAVIVGLGVAGIGLAGVLDGLISLSLGGPYWISVLWKLSGILMVCLPLVGLIYGGLLLIFKIKAPRWKPGLCGLILWIISIIVFCAISAVRLSDFLSPHENLTKQELLTSGPTLHVHFEGLDQFEDAHIIADGDEKEYSLVYYKGLDSLSKEFKLAVYPEIQILHSDDGKLKMRTRTRSLCDTKTKEELEYSSDAVEIDTDTLKLSPSIIKTGKKIKDLGATVKIYVPDSMKVVIDGPIEHHFDKSFNCSDLDIDSEKVQEIISSILR